MIGRSQLGAALGLAPSMIAPPRAKATVVLAENPRTEVDIDVPGAVEADERVLLVEGGAHSSKSLVTELPRARMVTEPPQRRQTFAERYSEARKVYMTEKPEGKAAQRRRRQMFRNQVKDMAEQVAAGNLKPWADAYVARLVEHGLTHDEALADYRAGIDYHDYTVSPVAAADEEWAEMCASSGD